MIDFFTKWKKESPKCFNKFENYVKEYDHLKFIYRYNRFYLREYKLDIAMPFEMLTGIIETFFEEEYNCYINIKKYSGWSWFIGNDKHSIYYMEQKQNSTEYKTYKTKQKCQMTAYLKSAEIVEKEIKKIKSRKEDSK